MRLYSVTGTIGAGKTTTLRTVALQNPDVEIVLEPVDDWESALQRFYDDRAAYAYALQYTIFQSYVKITQQLRAAVPTDRVVFVERGPWDALEIFTEANKLTVLEKMETIMMRHMRAVLEIKA